MKYKVVKEFDSLKKGNVLENSVEHPDIFVFEEENGNKYTYISYNDVILYDLEDQGYLIQLEEEEEEDSYSEELESKICTAVDEINCLLEQYKKDNETVHSKFGDNELPYCAVVEADTVHKNLEKVLTHIKNILEDVNE